MTLLLNEIEQTGDVVDVAVEGKEVVISRASAYCKRQSVLRADGYWEMMEVLHNQPRHKATAAMFSNKGLLFLDCKTGMWAIVQQHKICSLSVNLLKSIENVMP